MGSNKRTCRNCGSTEIYSRDVKSRGGYGPDLLPLGFFFSSPKFHLLVCGNCGLVEWFVPEMYLDKVKDKFSRES